MGQLNTALASIPAFNSPGVLLQRLNRAPIFPTIGLAFNSPGVLLQRYVGGVLQVVVSVLSILLESYCNELKSSRCPARSCLSILLESYCNLAIAIALVLRIAFNSPGVLLQQGGFFLLLPLRGLNGSKSYKFFFKGALKRLQEGSI